MLDPDPLGYSTVESRPGLYRGLWNASLPLEPAITTSSVVVFVAATT